MTKKNLFIIVFVCSLLLCFSIGYSIGNKSNSNKEVSKEKTAYELIEEKINN